jgi:hypothetical protein
MTVASAPTNWFRIEKDTTGGLYAKSLQGGTPGRFINFSLQADGTFGINISGSLSAIPQFAQVSAIIQGILGIFGLSNSPADPTPQPKYITIDAGVSLATLFGASQGINFLLQVLRGKINAIKNYVKSAVSSIENLFKCFLKNPLLAASLIAKLIRQGWISLPQPVKVALERIRDLINKTIGLNILINNPLTQFLAKLREYLQYKFPPPILLPYIPFIPGCTDGFYSGRPPAAFIGNDPINADVDPQTITVPGGFFSQIDLQVPTISIPFGPGTTPNLALTDDQISNLLGTYNPYDLYTSGVASVELDQDLNTTNFPTVAQTNSSVRQVQDKLISASSKVVNDITVLSKDISRAGLIPKTSPLDDLLCKPGEYQS